MEPKSKFLGRSLTVWGVLIGMGPALLAAIGVEVSADALLALDQSVVALITGLDQVNEGVGMALALYGRWRVGGVTLLPGRSTAIVPILAAVMILPLTGCVERNPLSTASDVEGYEDLRARHADGEAAARFDIFEAQADARQALGLIERVVRHPEAPAPLKIELKRLAQLLTDATRDYTETVAGCPGKAPDGGCPGFDYGAAKVETFRNLLVSVQAALLRAGSQGLLSRVLSQPVEEYPTAAAQLDRLDHLLKKGV